MKCSGSSTSVNQRLLAVTIFHHVLVELRARRCTCFVEIGDQSVPATKIPEEPSLDPVFCVGFVFYATLKHTLE